MDLRQLRSFAAVARHRHFTRAAEELHLAQSAVSAHVRKLEQELGMPLLERTSRRVALTEAGERVFARAQRMLAEADGLRGDVDELKGALGGQVALGAMLPMGDVDLPDLLTRFHARNPGIQLRLHEEPLNAMLSMLARDELDAGYGSVFLDELPPGLKGRVMGRDELVAALPVGDPLVRHRSLALAAFEGRTFIALRSGSAMRAAIQTAMTREGISPRATFDCNELGTVRVLTSRGLGVAVLPRSVADGPGPPIEVRPLKPRIHRPVTLMWRADRQRPPAAEAFLTFALAQAPGS